MPRDRILILGGTRDAREIANALVESGRTVVTSIAGVTAQPLLPAGEVRIGGFGGVSGLKSYIESSQIALVIDATHPFAARMSAQAFEACRDCGVLLLRFSRAPWLAGEGDRWTVAAFAAEAASILPPGARVLLTSGRKDLDPFFARTDVWGLARMIEEPPLSPPCNWTILRERPPFTILGERALMSRNAITHLVTKNAGGSATEAKLQAARELGIPVVMIARPAKPEVASFGTLDTLMVVVEGVLSP
ncbi:MAG: cobalt-precorrin-6A reductase [Aestuariivirga sp.]|uniref:cobalt-precorrin-6A reductase n=1 Tax=Aestuariivirga sp. TaxID=2650926 RepID=UPI0025BBF014|nr:cobalt-precorrin-6A reductase [Aestuariivirga sp.]MCA3560509.1 cobalt-precorrin-6A reductase [Aestuariivirga sp.]